MKQETYEISADSLEGARRQVGQRVPQGFHVLSERVVSDGKPVTLTETAEDLEAAFAAAKAAVPAGARILSKKEVQVPEVVTRRFSAEREGLARREAVGAIGETSVIKAVSLAVPGRRGFAGIGRTPNQYDVQILKKAVVEITYKTDAQIVVTAGDEIANWSALLSAIKGVEDPTAATGLFSQFGYQILFALLKAKVDEPSYFEGIPFAPITDGIVDRARRYVDHPPIPGLLAAFGMTLSADRYVVMPGGSDVGRNSNPQIDALIVQVAGCLRGRGTLSMNDSAGVCGAAYDAIVHYKNIPIVNFFFALPYFKSVIHSKQLSPNHALITVYKGVEGLLLEMWDELGEGQIITDEKVKSKVRQMMTG